MLIQINSSLNLGANTLRFALPNATNLSVLHIFSNNYLSGTSLQNLALNGTASTVTGSPTFTSNMMTVNTFGDGVLTTAFDTLGSLTVYGIAQSIDNLNTGIPVLATNYQQDGGAYLTGAKGFSFGFAAAGTGGIGTISTISRTSNVATVVLTAAPAQAYATGQLISVVGVTVDSTLNCSVVPMTVLSTTSFTYPSIGANLSTTSITGATSFAGYGKLNGADTLSVPSASTTITAISRTSNVVSCTFSSLPSGMAANSPIVVEGVTGDTTLNGIFEVVSVSGNTATYNSTGSNSTGVVTGATGGVGTRVLTSTLLTDNTYNTPRQLAYTINASTGVRTVYDFSSGSATNPIVGTNVGPRLGLLNGNSQAIQFGTGLFGTTFGKCNFYAMAVHVGACLTQSQTQQNLAVLALKTGYG